MHDRHFRTYNTLKDAVTLPQHLKANGYQTIGLGKLFHQSTGSPEVTYIQRPPFELYDLSTDPTESRNRAADPAHADLLARMKKQLREFQHQTADPWILKWD